MYHCWRAPYISRTCRRDSGCVTTIFVQVDSVTVRTININTIRVIGGGIASHGIAITAGPQVDTVFGSGRTTTVCGVLDRASCRRNVEDCIENSCSRDSISGNNIPLGIGPQVDAMGIVRAGIARDCIV